MTNYANRFTDLIKRYTDLRELNAIILNQLIDKLVIGNATKDPVTGERLQKIDIYYKFAGIIQA